MKLTRFGVSFDFQKCYLLILCSNEYFYPVAVPLESGALGGGGGGEHVLPTSLENVIYSLRLLAVSIKVFLAIPPPRYNFLPTVVRSSK